MLVAFTSHFLTVVSSDVETKFGEKLVLIQVKQMELGILRGRFHQALSWEINFLLHLNTNLSK